MRLPRPTIYKAQGIEGWMIDSELRWLAEQAQTHKLIVEVGCWQGRSTRALADNTEGIVWAVDTFMGSEEHEKLFEERGSRWLIERFDQNTKDLRDNLRLFPFVGSSEFAAMYFKAEGKQPDFVFLDAAHDYENVKADIENWEELIAPGGLIAGHDYRADGGNFPGVKQAVEEIYPDFQKGPNEIWYKQL